MVEIEGMKITDEFFVEHWYENWEADDREKDEPGRVTKLFLTDDHFSGEEPLPSFGYSRTRFACQLRDVTDKVEDGKHKLFMVFNQTFSSELATALVRSGDWDVQQAIHLCARACERCGNVLWNKYVGPHEGYEFMSQQWKESGTTCDLCEHLGFEAMSNERRQDRDRDSKRSIATER